MPIEDLPVYGRVVSLMTTNYVGEPVTLLDFRDPGGAREFGGPLPRPIRIKPGVSTTFADESSVDTLRYVASKDRKVFGELRVLSTDGKHSFVVRSEEFAIPEWLTQPPWEDLGNQDYLAITVDVAKANQNGKQLTIPVTITNKSAQSLFINSARVRIELEIRSGVYGMDLRDLFSGSKSISADWLSGTELLNPGMSVKADAHPYINLSDGQFDEWKRFRNFVVGVVGKIPGTNRVFESYSSCFKMPEFSGHP